MNVEFPHDSFCEKRIFNNDICELTFRVSRPFSNSILLDFLQNKVLYDIQLHVLISKGVNEYLNRYSNIRMGIRTIFEYSMVNDIICSHRNM